VVRIALDFNEPAVRDDGGQPATPRDPDGKSGCGIWRLVEAGTDARPWTTDDVKLVAIDHGHRRRTKVLVGTRIRYALQMIYRNHPGRRPAMEFHFGPNARSL
jgi:hypothetical protein